MLESALYIFAMLLCVGSMCLTYKTEKEESLIRELLIAYISMQCITSVVTMGMQIMNIPINLRSITVLYFVIFVFCAWYTFKQKKLQKVRVYGWDVYTFLVLGVFFLILFLNTFGTEIGIIYKNSDPGQHYLMALGTYNTDKISGMYFSPLQNALFMDLLDPFMLPISLYKAFILSDSVANFITMSMMYIVISTFARNKFLKIVTPIIIILWYMGWPFYSYVAGGYVYFGSGVMLFLYCIYWLVRIKECETKGEKIAAYVWLCLGIYNVSVCYMLFTPIIGLIAIWYIGKEVLNSKKISKCTILAITGIVSLVGIICFLVCFYGYFGGNLAAIFEGLTYEGGVHRELYKDILFLVFPAVCVIAYHKKKDNVIVTGAIISFIVVAMAFVAVISGFMSGYYFYKLYYLIWTFMFLLTAMSVEIYMDTNKGGVYAYFAMLLGISLISLSHFDSFLLEHELNISDDGSAIPIYGVNRWYVETSAEPEDMSSLRAISMYINEHEELQGKVKLLFASDKYTYGIWFKAFCSQASERIKWETDTALRGDFEELLDRVEKEFPFFIILKTSAAYSIIEDCLIGYEEMWEDDYVVMYRF